MPSGVRRLVVHLEEVRAEGGRGDAGGPLGKDAIRGRLNARLGGLAKEEVVGRDGPR